MHKGAFRNVKGEGLAGSGWHISVRGVPPVHAPSLFVVGNGFLGVRGVPEEAAHEAHIYLNAVYERVPIHYHEGAFGLARVSDTRLPAAGALGLDIALDEVRFDPKPGEILDEERALDFRTGIYTRSLRWRASDGQIFRLVFERLASFDRPSLFAQRVRIAPEAGNARIALSATLPAPVANVPGEDEIYDPRIGPALAHDPWQFRRAGNDEAVSWRVDRLALSGFEVAAAMAVTPAGETRSDPRHSAELVKFQAFASDRGQAGPRAVEATAIEALAFARDQGFDGLIARQTAHLDRFWANAAVDLPASPALERALRFNLLQIWQAVGADGESSIAAKGQTGEGYEGHVFWDAEIFMLPVFALLAPDRARAMLDYRARGLDKARSIARTMGHTQGALYPWRTIGGEECSAFFPAGTAQYHINADIAWAIRTYVLATGDVDFLDAHGVEMLIETARIWLGIGHYDERHGGQFCIDRVTGPDEYSALVDNNYYTNAMAKAHLLDAVRAAEAMSARDHGAFSALAARIDLDASEFVEMRRAAAAMRLPIDPVLGIIAQDDAFLHKKIWDFAGTPPEKYPLLLHHHPLNIYRHQVCKQADAVLALTLAGGGLDLETKRRTFDYYEAVTTHDSTLSPCCFAMAAAEIGELRKAYDYLCMSAFVDLEDLCGNTAHGLHMAALAGSWQALAFGFAGLRIDEEGLSLAPRFLPALGPYTLRFRFRGRRLLVEVGERSVTCTLEEGDPLSIRCGGDSVALEPARAARLDLWCAA